MNIRNKDEIVCPYCGSMIINVWGDHKSYGCRGSEECIEAELEAKGKEIARLTMALLRIRDTKYDDVYTVKYCQLLAEQTLEEKK